MPFAIVVGDEVIGYIQYSEETDPDYRRAGIDMFLGTPGMARGSSAMRCAPWCGT